jgi:hypothetical protein
MLCYTFLVISRSSTTQGCALTQQSHIATKKAFKECDWKEFYGDVREAIPSNAPEPCGQSVNIRMYVDSNHAGEKRTRRSRTGFFVFINQGLMQWISKRQATIETSVFGAEFVAMKLGMESLRGLRYKLRMMGVPINGPSLVYGDNMSVIYNTQSPESTLKKKCNSIAYHACRESVAMGESLTGHVPTNSNVADLATKCSWLVRSIKICLADFCLMYMTIKSWAKSV